MSSPNDHLDDALCHMLGLPKGDQIQLPLWKANLMLTNGSDGGGWVSGQVQRLLKSQSDETVATDPEKKAA
jgi:hypothetical protein